MYSKKVRNNKNTTPKNVRYNPVSGFNIKAVEVASVVVLIFFYFY